MIRGPSEFHQSWGPTTSGHSVKPGIAQTQDCCHAQRGDSIHWGHTNTDVPSDGPVVLLLLPSQTQGQLFSLRTGWLLTCLVTAPLPWPLF